MEIYDINGQIIDPLAGKTLYVAGDSIAYGKGSAGGYGKCIADRYGMQLINEAVDGATLATLVPDNVNGGYRTSIGMTDETFARALAAVFKGELVGLILNQATRRNLKGLLALECLTRGGLKARNDIVVASVRRSILELGAVFICLGVRLGLALVPREFFASCHAHLL